ncbi:MAG: metallophosphoesterase [Pirellulales bacterium]|nr:metallophosphoesterase [Pirellulales bacterium]
MKKSLQFRITCVFATIFAICQAPAAVLPVTSGAWTLAILPDTQNYATSYPSIFYDQTQFLADNRDTLNLAFVLHEGDVTNNDNSAEWSVASAAFQTLDNAGIPYAITPGNHDLSNTRTSLMPNYFPVSRLDNQPTFGGVYPGEPTSPLNSYSLFSAGGADYLVLALEYGPRDQIVNWADGLMKTYSDRQTIIVTHANLYCDGTRHDWAAKGSSQHWNPHTDPIASLPGGVNDGEEMWQQLKDNPNLKFIFNGHVQRDGAGYLADTGDQGNVVHNLLANYQFMDNGGEGYLRLLEFLPDGNTVHVRTYSPTLDSYMTAPNQDFTLTLNSPPSLVSHAVGANLVVAGETKPEDNIVGEITVPQSGLPQVGTTLQRNRGDYQIIVGGEDTTSPTSILLATVTQNVRDGHRATVEVGRDSFDDCQFGISVTEAGKTGAEEVNFNVATAWFKFDAGWQGAHVKSNGTIESAQGVTSSMVSHYDTGRYTVDLGVDSRNDGMLFVIANNNSNKIANTRILSDGSAWDVRVQDNVDNFYDAGNDANWSLLYLPYTTENLIGGRYDGFNGINLNSAGVFTMEHIGTGEYQLTIPGESPETGMLILSIAHGRTSGGMTAPDDNILNYESDGLGHFLINSYDLTGTTTLNPQDTHFVWAFIDFSDPIRAPVAPHTMTWNATRNGVWGEPAWSGAMPIYPNYSAYAVVNTPQTVTVVGDHEAISLSVSGGGKVVIPEGDSLNIDDGVMVESDGTLEIYGSLVVDAIQIEGTLITDDLDLGDATLNVTEGAIATLNSLVGTGAVCVSDDSTLTVSSICVSTLSIGGAGSDATPVPEPSVGFLFLTAAVFLLARKTLILR